MAKKIGRNDPCPCGSGKKYKKCHGAEADAAPRAPEPQGPPPRLWKSYTNLARYEAARRPAIEELFKDEFALIDDCLGIATRQVEILGQMPPASVEDAAMRDISCDAFEFLYESRRALAENRPVIVFPTMRRAFESTCLCHLFSIKPEFAKRWADGREISNSEVRKALENHPMTESVEQLKELYKHFSQGTHPNRSHVPSVFLGEGNRFTLGAIPPIDPLNLGHHVRHLMRLCYWYVGVVSWFYRESLPQRAGAQFAAEFLALTPRIQKLQPALEQRLDRLLDERAAEGKPAGVGLDSNKKGDV